MPTFKYRVISDSGQALTGVVEAKDEFAAADQVKSTVGGYLQSISKSGANWNLQLTEPKLDIKSLCLCCSQFSILLRAGLPLARTVDIVAEQSSDKKLKEIFSGVAEDVRAGFGLAESIEKRGPKLPTVFIETVRAGESSGTLEDSFSRMETYLGKSHKIKSKVRSALTYPAFLMVTAVVVIAIVVNVAIPTFAPMFEGRGLPLPTQILLSVYDYMVAQWYVPLGVLLLLIFGVRFYMKTQAGKENFSRLGLHIPIIGKVNTMSAASQFANTMSALLAAGLPMVRAMEVTAKVIKSLVVGQSIEGAVQSVLNGKRLGEAMEGNPYLPPLLLEMTAVGEESGSLEATLTTIGQYYDEETEHATATALSMMEPIITVVMGAAVGFILIALYLPMMTMGQGIV